MKLASYVVDGAEAYGVVKDDSVITMNNRFGGHAASLREALAGDLLPKIKEAAANASPEVANITRGQPSGNLRSPTRRLRNTAAATLHFSTRLACRSGDER